MSPPCLSTVIPVVTACKNLGSPLGKSPAISPRLLSCWDSNAVQGWDDGGQLQGGRGVSFFFAYKLWKEPFFLFPFVSTKKLNSSVSDLRAGKFSTTESPGSSPCPPTPPKSSQSFLYLFAPDALVRKGTQPQSLPRKLHCLVSN